MSLGARLTALVVGAFTVGLVVLGLIVPALVRDYLTDRLDEDLRSGDQTDLRALIDFEGASNRAPGPRNPRLDEAYVEVRDATGETVLGQWADDDLGERAKPDLPSTLPTPQTPFTVGSIGDDAPDEYRAMSFARRNRLTGEPATLVVALPTTEIDETVGQVVRVTVITAAAILAAVAVLSWLLVRLGLRPLRRMERTAAAIATAGDLHQRIEHPGQGTELGALGGTLNSMLERLEGSFAAQRASEGRLRRFVSDASHELRTPLTSIRGYAELYRRGGDSPEQVERSMGRIEDEAGRMARLVEDLLLLARLDETSPLERTTFDLGALVADLADDLRAVDAGRTVSVDTHRVMVTGDRHRLAQAVANVLANARLHTPAGTPIEVAARAEGPTAVVIVTDHGPGLPPADRSLVFDRFYRADPSRARTLGGSGLGLAITAAITAAHGGEITVDETPGGGATFRLRLPVDGSPDATTQQG